MVTLILPGWVLSTPTTHPNFTRDEMVVAIRPESYVLPVHRFATHGTMTTLMTIGEMPFRRTTDAWQTKMTNVYSVTPSAMKKFLASQHTRTQTENATLWDSRLRWLEEAVSQKIDLFYVRFDSVIEERTSDNRPVIIDGFLVRKPNLVFLDPFSSQKNEPVLPSAVRELDPNLMFHPLNKNV